MTQSGERLTEKIKSVAAQRVGLAVVIILTYGVAQIVRGMRPLLTELEIGIVMGVILVGFTDILEAWWHRRRRGPSIRNVVTFRE